MPSLATLRSSTRLHENTHSPPKPQINEMDVYPQELITHEAPLVVVSGLGSREQHSEIPPYPLLNNGPHVFSSLPSLDDDTSVRLAEYFQKHDATGIWGRRPGRDARATHPLFRIRLVGRVRIQSAGAIWVLQLCEI
jgi:hypothetical protein